MFAVPPISLNRPLTAVGLLPAEALVAKPPLPLAPVLAEPPSAAKLAAVINTVPLFQMAPTPRPPSPPFRVVPLPAAEPPPPPPPAPMLPVIELVPTMVRVAPLAL